MTGAERPGRDPSVPPADRVRYPEVARDRGAGFWLRPRNVWASRRKLLRFDHSNEWRYAFLRRDSPPENRSTPFDALLGRPAREGFRFIVLGDTGEGDRSQYSLLPLIRALEPDFLVITGDVAYPAGSQRDFEEGFFRPYEGLDVPIWAVPGNHEYYSPHRGQEFYETFCTYRRAAMWSRHGLRLVRQPATYWELRDPGPRAGVPRAASTGPAAGADDDDGRDASRGGAAEPRGGRVPLVVLGVDTGQAANLDGVGWRKRADGLQHEWLDARLALADARGDRALVLFHIPSLARERHVRVTRLRELHRILAGHPSVRLVVCGHEHHHESYAPEVFARYLAEEQGAGPPPPEGRPAGWSPPRYIVSGLGGAALGSTGFSRGPYPAERLFPSPEQWEDHVSRATKVAELLKLAKTPFGRLVARLDGASASDADAGRLLGFLLVEASPARIEVRHVFMEDLLDLFPDDRVLDVRDREPPLHDDFRDRVLGDPIAL